MKVTRYKQLEKLFSQQRILVIGDLMLDNYLWGKATRISPEAPVPIVHIESSSSNPGGAGNVACNLANFGANVTILGVVGDDQNGTILKNVFSENSIDDSGILVDPSRPTTVKTRIIAHSQQVVRADWEVHTPLSDELIRVMLESIHKKIDDCDALILEDYDKGLFNQELINGVIEICHQHSIPIYVDPKINNFLDYQGVTLIKPNLQETATVLNFKIEDEGKFLEGGQKLLEKLGCEMVLITRGEKGMTLFDSSGYHHISTKARKVHDVSGAGDTVIATFCLAHISGASGVEATTLANYAAGRVCEEVGVVPISKEKLHEIIVHHNS